MALFFERAPRLGEYVKSYLYQYCNSRLVNKNNILGLHLLVWFIFNKNTTPYR